MPAGAAHGEAGPQDERVADTFREGQAVFDGVDQLRLRQIQADLAHRVLEEETVFGFLDRVDLRSDQFHAIAIQNAYFGQRDGKIQAGLARRWRAGRRDVPAGSLLRHI